MIELTHIAYCGMHTHKSASPAMQDMRDAAARYLRRRRRQGFPVTTLERGRSWEIQEPDNSHLVPDQCGILSITGDAAVMEEPKRVTFNWGGDHDDADG